MSVLNTYEKYFSCDNGPIHLTLPIGPNPDTAAFWSWSLFKTQWFRQVPRGKEILKWHDFSGQLSPEMGFMFPHWLLYTNESPEYAWSVTGDIIAGDNMKGPRFSNTNTHDRAKNAKTNTQETVVEDDNSRVFQDHLCQDPFLWRILWTWAPDLTFLLRTGQKTHISWSYIVYHITAQHLGNHLTFYYEYGAGRECLF